MIFTNFLKYCEECPHINIDVSTTRQVDVDGEPVMTTTRITCKHFDICKRIDSMKEGDEK